MKQLFSWVIDPLIQHVCPKLNIITFIVWFPNQIFCGWQPPDLLSEAYAQVSSNMYPLYFFYFYSSLDLFLQETLQTLVYGRKSLVSGIF